MDICHERLRKLALTSEKRREEREPLSQRNIWLDEPLMKLNGWLVS